METLEVNLILPVSALVGKEWREALPPQDLRGEVGRPELGGTTLTRRNNIEQL